MLWMVAVHCSAQLRSGKSPTASRSSGATPAANPSAGSLLLPAATAYDSAGNLFFADSRQHQVFELTVAGVSRVVAGTGDQGFAGDGGPATAAMLNGPSGLAVSPDGTLYIADTGNQRIRAIAGGIISTVAGSGVRGFSGDGAALQAALRDPSSLAVDPAGRLLICDTGNQRLRRLTGGQLTTIAGNGVQGFGGDGSAGTAAELDTPLGVAANSAGTIYIADTHNQRIRMLGSDGTISTFAGTGVKGFSGDGAQASAAMLSQPFDVAVGSDGAVLIADSGNQRIRSISAAGIISTISGSGVQGFNADTTQGAAAALDSPRSVSVQAQGQPVFAESHNGVVRELADDNALYTLAMLAAPRTSAVSLSTAQSAVYGQGTAIVRVTGSAATPQGSVSLSADGATVGSAMLTSGNANLSLDALPVGSHVLSAAYAGDGLNGSALSSTTPIAISTASVIATANSASVAYGDPVPVLTGSLSGLLAQDSTSVHAVFSAAAGMLSPVGNYPISATLSGQGSTNYTLSLGANSGSLMIHQANSATALSLPAQAYAGLPMRLTATVAPATSGVPTGSVSFLDAGAVVGSAVLVNGTAATTIASASASVHAYSAQYGGDSNFLASASNGANLVIGTVPDFTVSVTPSNASVQGGSVAVFSVNLTPQNGPFTGAVTFSVSGLPQGATASFSPPSLVPGANSVATSLSVQTVALSGRWSARREGTVALAVVLLPLFGLFAARPSRRRPAILALSVTVMLWSASGCGTRTTAANTTPSQSFTLTVHATGTNLAGTVVSHTGTATLTVF